MLVLVIVALTMGELTREKANLLRQFMYIGGSCFFVAVVASLFSNGGAHILHFRVIPVDQWAQSKLPPPDIRVNNMPLDEKMNWLVRGESTAIVNVTDALSAVAQLRNQSEMQTRAINAFVFDTVQLANDLNRIPQILDKNCPGGQSGVSAQRNSQVIAITSRVASKIEAIQIQANASMVRGGAEK
jgi:hypothetical protein